MKFCLVNNIIFDLLSINMLGPTLKCYVAFWAGSSLLFFFFVAQILDLGKHARFFGAFVRS